MDNFRITYIEQAPTHTTKNAVAYNRHMSKYFRLGLALLLYCFFHKTQVHAEVPFKADFSNISWEYSRLLTPEDIPPPPTAPSATVHSIYSPSVIKYQNMYTMIFGTAPYCGIYRDSIAMAQSTDGRNWRFVKYLIEPDPRTCMTNSSGVVDWQHWPIGMQYQTNGPEIQLINDNGQDRFFVFFDSVLWKTPVNSQDPTHPIECNNIGLAIFDTNWNLLYRNNTYLKTDELNCQNTIEGFKSPAIQWINSNTTKLWFDKLGKMGSVPITNLSQLPYPPNVQFESIVGGDFNFPTLSYTTEMVLYGWGEIGKTITARSRLRGNAWSPPWTFLPHSGQTWDQDRQGSPSLLLDKESCTVSLFYSANAGFDPNTADHQRLSIAMAIPKNNHQFTFDACDTSIPKSLAPSKPGDLNGDGLVNIFDYNTVVAQYGKPYTIYDYNMVVANFGK